MDKPSYQVRINQWRSIIQEQAASHMSKKAWCRENGITIRQFYYWQRKLRNMILSTAGDPSPAMVPVKQDAPVFCELSVPAPQESGTIVPHADSSINASNMVLEIRDCHIVIKGPVSKDALASVVEVLRHV